MGYLDNIKDSIIKHTPDYFRTLLGLEELRTFENPVTLQLFNVDEYIAANNCLEVLSEAIRETSSPTFHQDGLFSETIFGQVASVDRLVKFGYIKLNTRIFHPIIFESIVKLKAFYLAVIEGKKYAKYDTLTKDLIPAAEDEEGAGTGYTFFMDLFPNIAFKTSTSNSRNDRVTLIEINRKYAIMDKYLVCPAAIRDIQITDNLVSGEEINKFYRSLLAYGRTFPYGNGENPMFDPTRLAIQRKANQIYDYLYDFMNDKSGFLQSKFTARNLALSTRNVITSAHLQAPSPDHPQFLKYNETRVPLFECIKAFQPLVVHNIKTLFFSSIFTSGANQIAVIDPDTYNLVYRDISDADKESFISSEGIDNMINFFRNKRIRKKPITIYDEKEKPFYLYMVYDEGDNLIYFRSLTDLQNKLQRENKTYDKDKVRPLTYIELFYVATWYSTLKTHVMITRYPVIEIGSTYPSKVHLSSTSPARVVKVESIYNDQVFVQMPEYPYMEDSANCVDSVSVHTCRLPGLGGDHDGDTITVTGILSDNANNEIADYLKSMASIIQPDGSFLAVPTYLTNLTIWNLTLDPTEQK